MLLDVIVNLSKIQLDIESRHDRPRQVLYCRGVLAMIVSARWERRNPCVENVEGEQTAIQRDFVGGSMGVKSVISREPWVMSQLPTC